MLDCSRIFFCSMFMVSSARMSDIDGLDLFKPGIWSGAILELKLCNAAVGEPVVDPMGPGMDTRGPFGITGKEGNDMPGIMMPGGKNGLGDSKDCELEVGVGRPGIMLVKGCLKRPKA